MSVKKLDPKEYTPPPPEIAEAFKPFSADRPREEEVEMRKRQREVEEFLRANDDDQ